MSHPSGNISRSGQERPLPFGAPIRPAAAKSLLLRQSHNYSTVRTIQTYKRQVSSATKIEHTHLATSKCASKSDHVSQSSPVTRYMLAMFDTIVPISGVAWTPGDREYTIGLAVSAMLCYNNQVHTVLSSLNLHKSGQLIHLSYTKIM